MFLRFIVIETIIATVFMVFSISILDYYNVLIGVSVAVLVVIGGVIGITGIVIGAIVAMKIVYD